MPGKAIDAYGIIVRRLPVGEGICGGAGVITPSGNILPILSRSSSLNLGGVSKTKVWGPPDGEGLGLGLGFVRNANDVLERTEMGPTFGLIDGEGVGEGGCNNT